MSKFKVGDRVLFSRDLYYAAGGTSDYRGGWAYDVLDKIYEVTYIFDNDNVALNDVKRYTYNPLWLKKLIKSSNKTVSVDF